MPQNAKELRTKLPGVGPYTAAAVASIAFNQSVGLVDGNVTRVFSRYTSIVNSISCYNNNNIPRPPLLESSRLERILLKK